MSIEHRNNPDSEECRRMTEENERDIRARQAWHKRLSQGWTGNRCPKCDGHGVVADSLGEEVSCSACAGTGDEYVGP